MQRRSLLAAALAAFLPVRAPANPVQSAIMALDAAHPVPVPIDEAWGVRYHHVRDDLWSRAELEARGEWPPGPLRTGEIGRLDRFTIHTSA